VKRVWLAEAVGTGLLLYVIVGSGIAAESLSDDGAVRLLGHALVVGVALAALIDLFQTVSGSHFNPSVALALWRSGDIGGRDAIAYLWVQVLGALLGVIAANVSFGLPSLSVATNPRSGLALLLAEGIATLVLVLIILSLMRSERSGHIPAAVGAWVGAIVFATSSTGFANPAVTVARMLTDSYTGIAPVSVAGFVVAQLAAGVLAAAAAKVFYPKATLQTAKT
jgi:glycerol uptake facilitator-like aquaporin